MPVSLEPLYVKGERNENNKFAVSKGRLRHVPGGGTGRRRHTTGNQPSQVKAQAG
jgi:hypothetical protein